MYRNCVRFNNLTATSAVIGQGSGYCSLTFKVTRAVSNITCRYGTSRCPMAVYRAGVIYGGAFCLPIGFQHSRIPVQTGEEMVDVCPDPFSSVITSSAFSESRNPSAVLQSLSTSLGETIFADVGASTTFPATVISLNSLDATGTIDSSQLFPDIVASLKDTTPTETKISIEPSEYLHSLYPTATMAENVLGPVHYSNMLEVSSSTQSVTVQIMASKSSEPLESLCGILSNASSDNPNLSDRFQLSASRPCCCLCLSNSAVAEPLPDLSISRRNTSKAIRKLISVPDERVVSKVMGGTAVVFLLGSVAVVVILDIPRLYGDVQNLFGNRRSKR